MTTNNNNLIIENKKPVEIVAELKETNWWEKYDKKTSHLSKSAQEELVSRKSGSEYVSENREGYGPTSYADAYCVYEGTHYKMENDRFFIILESEWGVDGQWFFGIPTYNSPKRSIDAFNDEARNFIDPKTIGSYNMSGIWQDGYMRLKNYFENSKGSRGITKTFRERRFKS